MGSFVVDEWKLELGAECAEKGDVSASSGVWLRVESGTCQTVSLSLAERTWSSTESATSPSAMSWACVWFNLLRVAAGSVVTFRKK